MLDFVVEYIAPVFMTIITILIGILTFVVCKHFVENGFQLEDEYTCISESEATDEWT